MLKFRKIIWISWMLLVCGGFVGCGAKKTGDALTEGQSGQHTEQQSEQQKEQAELRESVAVRVGSLKGPTSIGLLFLMNDEAIATGNNEYTFQMSTAADELLPLMMKGDLDIALVPANVASVFYGKSDGAICVADINTLGVLYFVSGADYQSVEELRGKTIYLTGKGTTPDVCLQYLLEKNGINTEECTLEYKSEPTEVAVLLAENPDAIGLLPQPFVTAACTQNPNLMPIIDMNAEWEKLQGSGMVTGVTIVRKAFLEEHEAAVQTFLADHAKSAEAIQTDIENGGQYVVDAGIVGSVPVAQKAIPACNITCITGEEMKSALQGYLEILHEQNPEFVGGALPEESFYYIK